MSPDAFEEMYRRHRRPLGRVVARIAGENSAEDFVHDAFVALLSSTQSRSRRPAWLARVARNRALTDLRRSRRVPEERERFQEGPGAPVARKAARDVVARAVDRLPERYRVALRLRYYEDCDYDSVAEALGVRVEQAHVVVHRAVRRLGAEVVASVASAAGAERCVPALKHLLGAGGRIDGHPAGPCESCRTAWDELMALRSAPAAIAIVSGGIAAGRRTLERAREWLPAFGQSATQFAAAATAMAIGVSGVASPPRPRLVDRITATTGAVGATSDMPATVSPAPSKEAARVPLADHSRTSAAQPADVPPARENPLPPGPVEIVDGPDHTQASVAGPGATSVFVGVCDPAEPCPP